MGTPGTSTSEFKLAIIAKVIGVALIALALFVFKGEVDVRDHLLETGKWLLMTAVGGYTISRGLAKLGVGGLIPALDAVTPGTTPVPVAPPAPIPAPANPTAAANDLAKL